MTNNDTVIKKSYISQSANKSIDKICFQIGVWMQKHSDKGETRREDSKITQG